MPAQRHYAKVAKDLRRRISGKYFETIECAEIVDMLREASGEDSELSTAVAAELEHTLLEENVRVFPQLKDSVKTNNSVRVFGVRSALAVLLDALMHPSDTTDVRLAEMSRKYSGMKSLLEIDDELIGRLEAIFSQTNLERMYEDGENLIEELKRKRFEAATRPKGRIVDDEFIRIIDEARMIARKSTGGRKLTDSTEIIREMREERDEQLYRAIRGNNE